MSYAWTISNWAKKPENRKAWQEIMGQHSLWHDPFEDVEAHFQFADFVGWGLAMQLSMNKAANFGWTGHVDTLESLVSQAVLKSRGWAARVQVSVC